MAGAAPWVWVIGSGRFGVALAFHLARKGIRTRLYGRDSKRIQAWQREGGPGDLFPDARFPSFLELTHDLKDLEKADILVPAIPTQALKAGLQALLPKLKDLKDGPVFVLVSKGLENETARLPHEILQSILPDRRFCVLLGPTFAEELIQGLPMAMVAASQDIKRAELIQKTFASGRLRVYTSDDVLGVELGGTIKNIFAIAAGISDGLELGHSARASLVSRAMAEMMRIAKALGGKPMTLAGLSGLGDLLLSTTSPKSRNYRLGVLLANGLDPTEFFRSPTFLAEGALSVKAMIHRLHGLSVETPILLEVSRVLFEGTRPDEALERLLVRSLKPEADYT
jgi:glycerol-3-phosphate dehydrogenase (NAD(P)+)